MCLLGGGKTLFRRHRLDGESVHAASEFIRQYRVDHAVTIETRFASKRVGHNDDAEMTFARSRRGGVRGMKMRLVHDLQNIGRESPL